MDFTEVVRTTFAPREPEAQALFGMSTHTAAAALVTLGRPVKQLTKLSREPVEDFAVVDEDGGAPLAPGTRSRTGAEPLEQIEAESILDRDDFRSVAGDGRPGLHTERVPSTRAVRLGPPGRRSTWSRSL